MENENSMNPFLNLSHLTKIGFFITDVFLNGHVVKLPSKYLSFYP